MSFRAAVGLDRLAMAVVVLASLAACAAPPRSNPSDAIIGGVAASQIVDG